MLLICVHLITLVHSIEQAVGRWVGVLTVMLWIGWALPVLLQVQKPDNAASGGSSSSSSDPASAAAGSLTTPASSPGSDGPTAKGSASLSSTGTTPPDELAALTARVLRSAGLVLGYLAFDGEGGLKVDRQEAVRYFKLAAAAGCKEAEQVLGWIYSTGQYG